jgi:BolA protein
VILESRSQRIHDTLARGLTLEHLEVLDESGNHSVPAGSESHFRVLVVSPDFADSSPLQRHRVIHRLLADELRGSLHALAVDAWTPEEWARKGQPSCSPACRGGGK